MHEQFLGQNQIHLACPCLTMVDILFQRNSPTLLIYHRAPVEVSRHSTMAEVIKLLSTCRVACSVQVHRAVSERDACSAGQHNADQGARASFVFSPRSATLPCEP